MSKWFHFTPSLAIGTGSATPTVSRSTYFTGAARSSAFSAHEQQRQEPPAAPNVPGPQLRSPRQLMAAAHLAFLRMKQSQSQEADLVELLLEVDLVQRQFKNTNTYSSADFQMALENWRHFQSTNLVTHRLTSPEAAPVMARNAFLKIYRRNTTHMASNLLFNGSNCVGRARLLFGARWAAERALLRQNSSNTSLTALPGDYRWALQVFGDHIQYVLYSSREHKVIDVLTGQHLRQVQAPIYREEVVLREIILKIAAEMSVPSPLTDTWQDYLLADTDPGAGLRRSPEYIDYPSDGASYFPVGPDTPVYSSDPIPEIAFTDWEADTASAPTSIFIDDGRTLLAGNNRGGANIPFLAGPSMQRLVERRQYEPPGEGLARSFFSGYHTEGIESFYGSLKPRYGIDVWALNRGNYAQFIRLTNEALNQEFQNHQSAMAFLANPIQFSHSFSQGQSSIPEGAFGMNILNLNYARAYNFYVAFSSTGDGGVLRRSFSGISRTPQYLYTRALNLFRQRYSLLEAHCFTEPELREANGPYCYQINWVDGAIYWPILDERFLTVQKQNLQRLLLLLDQLPQEELRDAALAAVGDAGYRGETGYKYHGNVLSLFNDRNLYQISDVFQFNDTEPENDNPSPGSLPAMEWIFIPNSGQDLSAQIQARQQPRQAEQTPRVSARSHFEWWWSFVEEQVLLPDPSWNTSRTTPVPGHPNERIAGNLANLIQGAVQDQQVPGSVPEALEFLKTPLLREDFVQALNSPRMRQELRGKILEVLPHLATLFPGSATVVNPVNHRTYQMAPDIARVMLRALR